jgi:hypothetical protein
MFALTLADGLCPAWFIYPVLALVPGDRAQISTFHLKTEAESSLRNVLLNKNRAMDNVQKHNNCITDSILEKSVCPLTSRSGFSRRPARLPNRRWSVTWGQMQTLPAYVLQARPCSRDLSSCISVRMRSEQHLKPSSEPHSHNRSNVQLEEMGVTNRLEGRQRCESLHELSR